MLLYEKDWHERNKKVTHTEDINACKWTVSILFLNPILRLHYVDHFTGDVDYSSGYVDYS